MYKPPSDPRFHLAPEQPTKSAVLVSYVMAAAIPLSLWALSHPLVGIAVLAAGVGLFVGARRASRLAWCVDNCRELTFDLAGELRVSITHVPTDDPN